MEVRARTRYYSKNGTFSVRTSGEITAWGTAAENFLGYSADEVVGNYCFDLLGKGKSYGKPCFPNCTILTNAQRLRCARNFSTSWKTKDDEWIGVDVSIVNLITEAEETEVLHIFKENSTERAISKTVGHAISEEMEESANQARLTRRECQVLQLIAAGLSTAEAADKLTLASVTARNHIVSAIGKLSANNRTHAVVKAISHKLI